jgi:membrane protein required for colicin V production
MNWLDIVIIVTLVINLLIGLKQGLIVGLLSLLGLVIGVILASNYNHVVASWLTFISNENIASIIAFAIILVAVMIIAFLLARVLKAAVSAIMLGWVDHLAGAVFGLFMGALFWGAVLAAWVKFVGPGIIPDSVMGKILLDRFPLILALLPNEFNLIRDFFK